MIEHQHHKVVGAIVSSLLLTTPIFGGEDREQLVATARDGNRAAIQSITSMECRFERKPGANTTLEQASQVWLIFSPGRFWRSGEVYRMLRPRNGSWWEDSVVRNGRGLFHTKGENIPPAMIPLSWQTLKPVDGVGGYMWQWLLFSHWGPEPVCWYPFHQIIENPHVIRKAERLPPPDNSIHIELTHGGGRMEFWFDPKVNYLIRKTTLIPEDKDYRWEREVVEFTEGAPAVFLPTTIEERCSVKGALPATLRTILTEVKVNQPLAENGLRIPGIAGKECIDRNREVKFKVDADGNQIGSESPIQLGFVSPTPAQGGPAFIGGDPPAYREPSKPPLPWWKWILLASLIVLITAVIAAIVRHRRQAMQT